MTCLDNLNGSYNVQNNESDTDSVFVIKASPFQQNYKLDSSLCIMIIVFHLQLGVKFFTENHLKGGWHAKILIFFIGYF